MERGEEISPRFLTQLRSVDARKKAAEYEKSTFPIVVSSLESAIFLELLHLVRVDELGSMLSHSTVLKSVSRQLLAAHLLEVELALYFEYDANCPIRIRMLPEIFDGRDRLNAFQASLIFDLGHSRPRVRSSILTICQRIELRIQAFVEVLRNLQRRKEANRQIKKCHDLTITDMRIGLSDPHNHLRTVCLVSFSDGSSIVYKPRPLSCEELGNRIVHTLNPHLVTKLKTLEVDPYSDFGFQEFCPSSTCDSNHDVELLHIRLGSLLAICQALSITDCHHENILINGSFPYLIDAETLGHPRPRSEAEVRSIFGSPSIEFPNRTGFFPEWSTEKLERGSKLRSGGLLALKDIFNWKTRARWSYVGTDALALDCIEKEPEPPEDSMLSRAFLDPIDYLPHMIRGYRDAISAIQHCRSELECIVRGVPDFPVRFIFRDTEDYWTILHRHHGDAREQGLSFDLGRAFRNNRHLPDGLLASEIDALRRGDIPHFTLRLDDNTSLSDGIERIRWKSTLSPRETIPASIDQVCAYGDNAFPAAICMCVGAYERQNNPGALVDVSAGEEPDLSLIELRHLKEQLERDSHLVAETNQAFYLGISRTGDGTKNVFSAMEIGLGRGQFGMLPVLGSPKCYSDAFLHRTLAQVCVNGLEALHAYKSLMSTDSSHFCEIGISGGIGGVCVAVALTEKRSELECILEVLLEILTSDRFDETFLNTSLDVYDGISGLLIGLCLFQETNPSSELQPRTEQLIHLLQQGVEEQLGQSTPSKGLAHGLAGAGLALLRAESFSKSQKTRSIIEAILDIEQRYWCSNGLDSNGFGHRCATANSWCKGMAGYLILSKEYDGERNRDPVEKKFYSRRIFGNHTLCCGALGEKLVKTYLEERSISTLITSRDVETVNMRPVDWGLLSGVLPWYWASFNPEALYRFISLGGRTEPQVS